MRMQRTPVRSVIAFAVAGLAIGLLLQLARSAQGSAPLVPPVSLAATLLVIAAVLLLLAVLLRRAVRRNRRVNPFHAVRLLAGARAGQFAGALFGGFGGGSFLQLLGRSVMPPSESWLPMILVLVSGAVLVVCGIIAEAFCRVPPQDPEEDSSTEDNGVPGEAGFMP